MSEMNKKVTKAFNFCREAHDKQKRKYTGEPYWCHPVEVMNLVEEAGGSDDMLCAALLHDVVEDTKYGVDDIREMFGNKVSELVYWLTDKSKPEDGNREVRKAIDREHISKAPKEAKTIKLADMISNAGSITDLIHTSNFIKFSIIPMIFFCSIIVCIYCF